MVAINRTRRALLCGLIGAVLLMLQGCGPLGDKVKLVVEPAPSGNIVMSSYCGDATATGNAPVYIPGNCYVTMDGPQSMNQSQMYSCNGTDVSYKVFETADCSGPSYDAFPKAGECRGYSSFKCAAAKADTTYVSIYDALSDTACGAGVSVTLPADNTCGVVSVRGMGKLAYDKSCKHIQWIWSGDDSECKSVFSHWTGKSGDCADTVRDDSVAPICPA